MTRRHARPVAGRAVLASLLAAASLSAALPARAEGPPTPPESAVALQFRPNHVALRVADLETSVDW
ncbi:MAG: hypothetical protein ACFBWO_08070 [Paracoccaceae bacterium]